MSDHARGVPSKAEAYLRDFADLVRQIDPESVALVVQSIWRAWQEDHVVFICGNGGSATTAEHMACDLTKQTLVAGRRALRAMALTDNMAIVTSWANDADFARVFAEQLRVHGRPGDLLICISGSGASPNIVEAVDEAHALGMSVVALGGFSGGPASERADIHLHVPAQDYGLIESAHIVLEHCVTALLHDAALSTRQKHRTPAKPVVIIDRDGVINRNLEEGVRGWTDFEFLPGALEGLAALSRAGHRIVVVTNQANIGRGILTWARLTEIHRRMETDIVAAGGVIEAVFVCEHPPEAGCDCRKPAPGLLYRAAAELQFPLEEAYLIGDHRTDVEAARAAGAHPVLVLSGREKDPAILVGELAPDLVADNLAAAASVLVEHHRAVDGVQAVATRAGD